MKRKAAILAACFVIMLLPGGCTKEKALALQAASLKLMVATEKAITDVQQWWNASYPSASDLTGDTIDEKVLNLAGSIVGGGTKIGRTELINSTKDIVVELSEKETIKKLAMLKEGASQINQALTDLDKGALFAAKAIKDLKPPMNSLLGSFVNLSDTIYDLPVPEQSTDSEVLAIRAIMGDRAKNDELKKLEIAGQLRKIVEKKQEYKILKDKAVASLLVAAKYSMDILKQIDNYEKMSLEDILALTDEWGPLAVRLSQGKVSQEEIDGVRKSVREYAKQIGVLDRVINKDQKRENVAPGIRPIDN